MKGQQLEAGNLQLDHPFALQQQFPVIFIEYFDVGFRTDSAWRHGQPNTNQQECMCRRHFFLSLAFSVSYVDYRQLTDERLASPPSVSGPAIYWGRRQTLTAVRR